MRSFTQILEGRHVASVSANDRFDGLTEEVRIYDREGREWYAPSYPIVNPSRLESLDLLGLDSVVYCIQGEHGGPVKIGISGADSYLKRVKTLQTGNPLRLVVRRLLAGDRNDEARIHSVLSDFRMAGEWFHPTGPVAKITGCITDAFDEAAIRQAYADGFSAGLERGHCEAYEDAARVVAGEVVRTLQGQYACHPPTGRWAES